MSDARFQVVRRVSIDLFTVNMAEEAMTDDAPVIEDAAAMDPADEAAAPVDAAAIPGDAEENEATGAADLEPVQKSPSTAQRAKPKRIDVEPDKIMSGSRHRRSVAFYQPETIHVTEKLAIESGKGEKLSSIPNVAFKLSKLKPRDKLTEMIHMLFYKRKGEVTKRKRDIGEFSGWVFTDDEREKEEERASEFLSRFTNDALNDFLDILDLPRGADKKEAKVKRAMEFLQEPKAMSEKDLAAQDAKRKAAAKRKRETKPAKASKVAAVEQADDVGEDDEAEEDEEEEQEEEEEEEEQPKRRRSKSKGKAAAAKPKSAPKKATKGRKKAAAAEEAEEDGEDDDMPLAAAAATKKLPSDKQLVMSVEEILAGEDVQSFALSALMKRLREKHGVDLTKKKPIIKATAIRYCQEHAEAQEDDAAEEEEKADEEEDKAEVAVEGDVIAPVEEGAPADEERPVAAVVDTQPAVDANGDKSHTKAPAAEGGENEDGAAKDAEQFDAAQKAALAAGNGEEPEL